MDDRIQGTPELRVRLKRFHREWDRVRARIKEIEATHKYKAQVSLNGGKLLIHVPEPPRGRRSGSDRRSSGIGMRRIEAQLTRHVGVGNETKCG